MAAKNPKPYQKSLRMSEETWRQVTALLERTGDTFPELVARAIENLYTLRIESKKKFRGK